MSFDTGEKDSIFFSLKIIFVGFFFIFSGIFVLLFIDGNWYLSKNWIILFACFVLIITGISYLFSREEFKTGKGLFCNLCGKKIGDNQLIVVNILSDKNTHLIYCEECWNEIESHCNKIKEKNIIFDDYRKLGESLMNKKDLKENKK